MLAQSRSIAVVDVFPAPLAQLLPQLEETIARGVAVFVQVHQPTTLAGAQVAQTYQGEQILAYWASAQQQYQLEQATIKAKQDQVAAEGAAAALRARAQGEADATKIRAEAQAEANRQLAQSLTGDLIRYEQLQRWDGKLPVFSGGGATPLIDATSIISDTAGQ